MAKDPAFLWYPGDWLGGTMVFTREQKGAYIDLLMAQFNMGHLSAADIKDVLNSDFEKMWECRLKAKFKLDENGLYYNEKLEIEINKRKKFIQHQKDNISKRYNKSGNTVVSTTVLPLENENENENKKDSTVKKESPPEMNVSLRVYFDTFKKLYPKNSDGVFEGTAECEEWFREWSKITDFKLLLTAVKRYAQSDKVIKGFAAKPINWLKIWQDWAPKVSPRDQAKEVWTPDPHLVFGPCTRPGCRGVFQVFSCGAKTKSECSVCHDTYVAPVGAAEEARKRVNGFRMQGVA